MQESRIPSAESAGPDAAPKDDFYREPITGDRILGRRRAWLRLMTPANLVLAQELATWLGLSRRQAVRLVKRSKLPLPVRMKPLKRGHLWIRWYCVSKTTFRAFVFAEMDKVWEEVMLSFPPRKRVTSPWITYRALLRPRSVPWGTRSLRWRAKLRITPNSSWSKQRTRQPGSPPRKSSAISPLSSTSWPTANASPSPPPQ